MNLNQAAREDVLDCLRMTEVQEPTIEFLPEPPQPEVVPVVLSEPDEPLYTPVLPIEMPKPEPVAPEAVTPAPPVVKNSKSRLWMLPAVAAVVALIATPLAYKFLSVPAALPDAVAKTEPTPQPIEPAAIKTVSEVPVVKPKPSTLPLIEADVLTPPEPTAAVPTAPVSTVKNALILPADALKIGQTKFLNGTWRVLIDMKDPITGKPPTLRYQIANNKGSARLVHGDNVVCKVEVFSGLQQSGTLMIKTRGSARCSDGTRYPMPEISCKPGENDVAECSGRYEGDTVVPMTFKKVSD